MDIIDKINSENNRKLIKIKLKKIKPQKITLKDCDKEINFKLYDDSQLEWPVDSFLVCNER
jgi:hypothetical protein